jgi:putative DNA primase/helicase
MFCGHRFHECSNREFFMDKFILSSNDSLLLDYLEAGLALIAIPSGKKGPTSSGWNRKENVICSAADLSLISGNVGLAHAFSYPLTCALDVDHFERASGWLTERGIDLSALLNAGDSVQIVSGREGRAKLLYRLLSGTPPLETKQIKEGDQMILELRCSAKNGTTVQYVLPPSLHPETGQPYRWGGKGHFSQLPVIPSALLALWEETRKARAKTPEPFTEPKPIKPIHSIQPVKPVKLTKTTPKVSAKRPT